MYAAALINDWQSLSYKSGQTWHGSCPANARLLPCR
jgi:hypothetical protein